MNTYKF